MTNLRSFSSWCAARITFPNRWRHAHSHAACRHLFHTHNSQPFRRRSCGGSARFMTPCRRCCNAPPSGKVRGSRCHRPGRAPSAWSTTTTRATGSQLAPNQHGLHAAFRRLQQQTEGACALGWSPRLYGDCRVCSSKSSREEIGIVRASSGLRCSSAQKSSRCQLYYITNRTRQKHPKFMSNGVVRSRMRGER